MKHKFTLTNAVNDVLDLGDLDNFAYEALGLGIKMQNEYANDSPNFISVSPKSEQGQLQLKIIFGADSGQSEKRFAAFAAFLARPPYVLSYETDAGQFKRDCMLSEVTKSKVESPRAINEGVSFDFLGLWYRWVSLKSTIDDTDELEVGLYGKTYVAPHTADPAKVELVNDPAITSADSITAPPIMRPYLQISANGAPFDGNVLMVDAKNIPKDSGAIVFNSDMATTASKFEFWYRVDEIDSARGEFLIAGQVRAFIDGYEIDVIAATSSNTAVFLPESTSAGWHHIVLLSLEPLSASVQVKNSRGYVYFCAPSLYDVVVQSGGLKHCYIYQPHYVYGDYTANELKQYGVFPIYNHSKIIGQTSSPAVVRVSNATNPSWRLFVNSQILQSDGYFVDVGSNSILEVSSVPNDQFARTIEQGGLAIANVYSKQDITKTNFITIPQGASTLVFEGVRGQIDVEYREEHSLV
jgi:hypothetical protein